ncbi:MAG: leucyl aminopeptidase family protein [Reinekea sp.]|nr:leucyl aminopeptidase family protein [Reinekea sp.]
MKTFDYPQLQLQQVTTLPADADCCIEWRETSEHALINQHLNGERRLRQLLPNGVLWSFGKAPKTVSEFERLTLARAMVLGAMRKDDRHLVLIADDADHLQALLSAALAAQYELPTFKKNQPAKRELTISLLGPIDAETISLRQAEAEGNAYTRYLTALPANELNPWSYRELIEELAETEGWECKVYRYKELEKMGAGAFLAVARGSMNKEASIVRVHYKGNPDSVDTIALVGKGVTMDTGGYNLKTGGSMFGMNGDMNGSAVVLGNMLAATRRGEKVNMTGWLALTDNHIGSGAYHANEWVRALNGTTIEVVDTDAEGRMILADTLTLASREHPKAVIDYATLTGACIAALSTRYSGVFTNHEPWFLPLIEAGKQSGERIWPFPIDADYDENIKSNIADIQQCNPGKSSDHIDAARFLSRFIEPNVPWVHVDLASAVHKGGLAHVSTDITGFGIRLTQNLFKMLF